MRTKTAPSWVGELVNEAVERDGGHCVNCGRLAVDVHHIVPRSRAKRWSRKVWRVENMCCLCRTCHKDGQATWMREKLIAIMGKQYDMSWTAEFGTGWQTIWEFADE